MKEFRSNTKNNQQALLITLLVHSLLLLAFFLFSFKKPETPPPVIEEGIEVNLGNSDIGFGDVQPLQTGEPAPTAEETSSVPSPSSSEETSVSEKEVTDKDDAETPEIIKPTPKKETKKDLNEEKIVKAQKKSAEPVIQTKKETKPKALFTGGNGTGGNGQDSYNNSNGEGTSGGKGDQGKPGGDPNSDSYSGEGGNGNGGPRVISGNRKIVKAYSFEGELDKATIYAVIKVSPSGKGTWQDFGKKSTSRSSVYKNAIINYLPRIQFNTASEESMVTVQFEFSIRD